MASVHTYMHLSSLPPPTTLTSGKKMDSPPGNPTDQLLSLLSSLVINGPVSGVNTRPGTQTAGNVVGAQVGVCYRSLKHI
jgi:hypothetical protein